MLFLINQILILIPFKIGSFFHRYILSLKELFVNILIWLKAHIFAFGDRCKGSWNMYSFIFKSRAIVRFCQDQACTMGRFLTAYFP